MVEFLTGRRSLPWPAMLLAAAILAGTAISGYCDQTNDPLYADEASSVSAEDSAAYVPGQLVIRFAGEAEVKGEFARLIDTAAIDKMDSSPVYLLQFDPTVNLGELGRLLQSRDGVSYAQPNYILDSLHPLQGSRPIGDAIGGNDMNRQYAVDLLELTTAHTIAVGAGVKVGIIDGGVDANHPAFSNCFSPGYDFVDNDEDTFDEPGGEVSGHGTFVAGIVHMVAPEAEIVPYRVMNANGAGHGFNLARAIERAVLDGCDIINISLVVSARHRAVAEAIDLAESKNVVMVAAAGNDGDGAAGAFPATHDCVFGVAAVDSQLVIPGFSSGGSYVDFHAPGVDVYSSYLDDGYAWWSGTSFSAAFFTGATALIKQTDREATRWDILQALLFGRDALINEFTDANLGNSDSLWGGGLVCAAASAAVSALSVLRESLPPDTTPFAAVLPSVYYCRTADLCTSRLRWHRSYALTSDRPYSYAARVLPGGSGYITIHEDNVICDTCWGGPFEFAVVNSLPQDPGVYIDTIQLEFEGIAEPCYITVYLDASESCCPPSDSAAMIALTESHFTINKALGSQSLDTAYFSIQSTNAPAPYVLWSELPGNFWWEPDQLVGMSSYGLMSYFGTTPDTISIVIDGIGVRLGTYYDTLFVSVSGVANDVIPIPLSLEILHVESNSESDSRSTIPATLVFDLPRDAHVLLTVQDVAGSEVRRLIDGIMAAGKHEMTWYGTDRDGVHVPAGMYVLRLRVDEQVETEELILVE